METRTVLAWLAGVFEPQIDPTSATPAPSSRYSHVDPTPEQIQQACREIQANWSDRDRVVRAGGDPDSAGWQVPRVRVEGVPGEG